jgi:glycosyltransferase involved in cell wall biosynthesis
MEPSNRSKTARYKNRVDPSPSAAKHQLLRSAPQALLVLGMHRNGTSAFTRVFNVLGADLPRNLLGPTFSNEAGHWESNDLLAIHEDLLSSVGSKWDDWRAIDPNWYSSPAAEEYKLRLLKQLQQDFSESRFFVVKDPRICRFVPLWRDVLQRFGADTHVVISVRDPIEVGDSLQRRDGFPPAKSYLVWLRHILDAEVATRNIPRAVVTYDSLIRDWRQVVARIAQWTNLEWPNRSEQTEAEIDRFLVAQLRHHVADPRDLAARADIVDWVKSAYRILHETADKGESKEQHEGLDKIRLEFETASAAFDGAVRDDVEQLRKENTRISTVLKQELKDAQALAAERDREFESELRLTRDYLDELRDRMKNLVSYMSAGPSLTAPAGALGPFARFYWSLMQRTKTYRRWQYEAIRTSQFFDSPWYLARYPDVAAAGADPLWHFVIHGAKERRSPHPLFEPESYARPHSGTTVLKQTAATDPRFSNVRRIFQAVTSRRSYRLVKKSGLFDPEYYLRTYPDLQEAKIDPLAHFMIYGAFEGRNPSPWFQTKWYLWRYPDIEQNRVNPLLHYLLHGAEEGRDPNPWFNTVEYFLDHPGLAEAKINPLGHYAASGTAKVPETMESKLFLESSADRAVKSPQLTDLIDFPPRDLCPSGTTYNPSSLDVHWIVPDFAPGGGGIMTIFRIVRLLEQFGHRCTIWIARPHLNKTERSATEVAIRHYPTVQADIKFLTPKFFALPGDVLICTSWETVVFGMHATGFKDRLYFVQDYEPAFFPVGSHSLAAEWTYRNDIGCICASPWLAEKLEKTYGSWTRTCWLAVDREIYRPLENARTRNPVPRIAFYARRYTERRAVDLGLLALEHLAKSDVQFHVDFFGAKLDLGRLPYSFTDRGILTESELAALYQQSDVGVVFSSTNYSLVPQEMMASGLAVLELDAESTRRIYPEEIITLAGPHPIDIAEKLEGLLANSERRADQANAALTWVSQFSWEKFARTVESAIHERLQAKGFSTSTKALRD